MDKVIFDLQELYQKGIGNSLIKKDIIDTLKPYFENLNELESNFTSSPLLSAYEYIKKYSEDEVFVKGLTDVLMYYRNALETDKDATIKVLLAKVDEFLESENKMWSIRNEKNEFDHQLHIELDIYDSVIKVFQITGSLLEINVRNIISELYGMSLIINNKEIDYQKICQNKFGTTIKLLLETGNLEEVLKIQPHDIKLSDWRNIAVHGSYYIENNQEIVMVWGEGVNKNTIKMNYEEFIIHFYQIMRSSNILNIARCLFVVDNLALLKEDSPAKLFKQKFRDDMLFNQIKISLASEGFRVMNIYADDIGLKMEIQDVQRNNYNKNYIAKRETVLAQLFGARASGFPTGRIDIEYYSSEGEIIDIFWISLTYK